MVTRRGNEPVLRYIASMKPGDMFVVSEEALGDLFPGECPPPLTKIIWGSRDKKPPIKQAVEFAAGFGLSLTINCETCTVCFERPRVDEVDAKVDANS